MITLFKNPLDEITILERETLVPILMKLLDRTNQKNKFTGKRIIEFFTVQGYPISQIRLCKMISYIRIKNLMQPNVVIGSNNGYFLTADENILLMRCDHNS